jgi:hypothetical protein
LNRCSTDTAVTVIRQLFGTWRRSPANVRTASPIARRRPVFVRLPILVAVISIGP